MVRVKQKLAIGRDEDRLPGLQYDGDKVYCGLCGKGFSALALHILKTHNMPLDEYREYFGLNRTQPLWTPELSAKHRAIFIRRGMAGKYKFSVPPSSAGGLRYRRQGHLTLQDSEAVRIRQSNNGKKAYTLVPCADCGKPTKGLRTDKRKFYCPECWKAHGTEYQRQWRETHRESGRLANRRCRAAHLEEYRRRGREYWKTKYPIRRIVTQPCLNCGQITTGSTSHGKLFCLDCRRNGAPAHLYYLEHK